MQSEPLFDLPTRVVNLVNTALALGWETRTTYSDIDGESVCIRFNNNEHHRRCYAIWFHTITERGKHSVTWGYGGSANLIPLKTFARLTEYLTVLDDEESLSDAA